ncbi:MAG: helicase-related protein [Enterobacterales bacterium]|nr:helicase-related protein [Enterobacterales bacterium]
MAQAAYADLDLSTIDELPLGRKPIETSVISDIKRDQVINRIEQACKKDQRQVYWVCTLIDESEEIESQAAEAAYQQLSQQLPSLKIGLVHGRLKSVEKNGVMRAFKQGELDILVATTVIEVGVDVPNATLMIIENPERLGLSQLHQLRGRVGRGDKQSYCVLMYHAPLSGNAKQRLSIMRETNDGFKVAQQDLMLRGAGEVLGTRQTGEMLYRFADLARDSDLLPQVIKVAQNILLEYPHLIQPLSHRWLKSAGDLAKV